jgi:hypothetical protein
MSTTWAPNKDSFHRLMTKKTKTNPASTVPTNALRHVVATDSRLILHSSASHEGLAAVWTRFIDSEIGEY